MSAPDLTGWTPNEGKGGRPDGVAAARDIIALFRGTEATGPRHSSATPAIDLDWHHHAATNYTPSPMDMITGDAPPQPSSDLIAWRFADDDSPHVAYPHVRADLGQ